MHCCLILIWNTCYETKKRNTNVFIHPWILQQKAPQCFALWVPLAQRAFGTKGLRHKAPSALDAFGVTRRGAQRLRRCAPAALVAGGFRHRYLTINWNWFQERAQRECLRMPCKTMSYSCVKYKLPNRGLPHINQCPIVLITPYKSMSYYSLEIHFTKPRKRIASFLFIPGDTIFSWVFQIRGGPCSGGMVLVDWIIKQTKVLLHKILFFSGYCYVYSSQSFYSYSALLSTLYRLTALCPGCWSDSSTAWSCAGAAGLLQLQPGLVLQLLPYLNLVLCTGRLSSWNPVFPSWILNLEFWKTVEAKHFFAVTESWRSHWDLQIAVT